ncbi:MAG: coiled-coil domain-containing protein [Bacteroidota bacterium]
MREINWCRHIATASSFGILALLVLLMTSPVQAQESDYELIEQFRADYQEVQQEIDLAEDSEELLRLESELDRFSEEYDEHRELIDAALHPVTLQEHEESLESRWNSSRKTLARVDELHQEIEALQGEMEQFRGEIADRDDEIESIESELNQSREQVEGQADLVRQYRESIQDRDRMVSYFLSDLLNQYDGLSPESSGDQGSMLERMEEQPVDLLKTLLGEYVNKTNDSTDLETVDYLAMKAQYRYFNQWWGESGEFLVNTLETDSPVQSWQEITDLLDNWNSAIESRVWVSIQSEFADQGVQLEDVQDSESLYNSIRSHLEQVMREARETNRSEELDRYERFASFWNGTVKNYWGEVLIPANVLNHEQISSIDELMVTWYSDAVPYTNIALLFLVIAVFFVIVLIITNVRTRVGYKQEIAELKKNNGGS